MRYGPGAVKVLVCCANEIVCDAVALSLSRAGHQAVASSDPVQLVANLAVEEVVAARERELAVEDRFTLTHRLGPTDVGSTAVGREPAG